MLCQCWPALIGGDERQRSPRDHNGERSPPLEVSRKLAILGYRGVGKTSLATQYAQGSFSDAYTPTIENTFNHRHRIKRTVFRIEIVDSAGMDENATLPRNASVGVHGYLLVFSAADRLSFEKIEFINMSLLSVQGMSPGVVRILVATCVDLERQVDQREGSLLAEKLGSIPYIECSAKTKTNIAQAFATLIAEVDKDTGFLQHSSPSPNFFCCPGSLAPQRR